MHSGFQMGHKLDISVLTGDTLFIKNPRRQMRREKERQQNKKLQKHLPHRGFGKPY